MKANGPDRLADFGPGLLKSVDGAAVQRGGDLQHAVVVVEAAADVGHGHPLLYGAGPGAHVSVGHDLGCHQVAHLQHQSRAGGGVGVGVLERERERGKERERECICQKRKVKTE